jgi:hypothetical protein
MNKKILATLLIASIALTGLFAAPVSQPGKSAILNANKTNLPYTFVMNYGDIAATGGVSTVALAGEGISLDSEDDGSYLPKTTASAFTVSTETKSNVGSRLSIKTTISTGPFIGPGSVTADNSTGTTTSFPFIVDTAASNTLVKILATESYAYAPIASTEHSQVSAGTYTRSFKPGVHVAGTIVAQFKLSLIGNDDIGAGAYTSTSTIGITVE